MVAELMAVSTRAAPKSASKDFPDIKVLEGDDVQSLTEGMLSASIRKYRDVFSGAGSE
jgi:uncharacterized ferredoxin-like protein